MNTEKLTELIGDLTVFDLSIDFKNKSIIMNLGYLPFEKNPTKKITFNDVFWQDFSGFDRENIQNYIAYNNNFNTFLQNKKDYIEKNIEYFPTDLLEILKNNQHHYYYSQPTLGFEFLIITQTEISISDL
ncbi:hypothetical protein [Empedobacter brevis]|uniref:hypothetical protein n=1 Tax=Empedobacter brevis TaxID=247 RepID=UPI002FE41042